MPAEPCLSQSFLMAAAFHRRLQFCIFFLVSFFFSLHFFSMLIISCVSLLGFFFLVAFTRCTVDHGLAFLCNSRINTKCLKDMWFWKGTPRTNYKGTSSDLWQFTRLRCPVVTLPAGLRNRTSHRRCVTFQSLRVNQCEHVNVYYFTSSRRLSNYEWKFKFPEEWLGSSL